MNTLQITTPHCLSEFQIEKGEHVALTFRLLNASKLENELGSKVLSYLTGQCLSDLYPTICRYQGCIDQIDLYEIVVTWQRSTSIDLSNVVSFFFESVEILGQHADRYKREFNAVPVWVGFVCVYDNEPKQTESINLPIRLPSFEFSEVLDTHLYELFATQKYIECISASDSMAICDLGSYWITHDLHYEKMYGISFPAKIRSK